MVGTGVGPQDQAFRSTQETGIVGLGFLPGYAESIAFGVSADGSVVVGNNNTLPSQASQFQAFRWTAEGGMVGLGFLLPGGFSSAEGVSANGRIVVGASDSISGRQAFLWTEEDAMIGLGDLPGRSFDSFAHNVSANGSVVVGISDSASGFEAFRWTQAGGMVGLGFLPGDVESDAFGVSADGSVIVGRSHNPGANERFRDTIHGMQDLRDVLISQGDDLTGWELIEDRDVSADGRTITGRGRNPAGQEEAWLARLDLQLSVALVVRPGSAENPVNPKSHGIIQVAILGTNGFDASTIDQASLRFGLGQALAEGNGHLVDLNGDGQLDLVLHFRTQDSGVQCSDTSVSITGQTLNGILIQGSDSITTVGCPCPVTKRKNDRRTIVTLEAQARLAE